MQISLFCFLAQSIAVCQHSVEFVRLPGQVVFAVVVCLLCEPLLRECGDDVAGLSRGVDRVGVHPQRRQQVAVQHRRDRSVDQDLQEGGRRRNAGCLI